MEFEEPLHLNLNPCSFCGRKFAQESLQRHEKICQKTSRKRPVFNSSKQRSVESGEANFQKRSNAYKPSNYNKALKQSTNKSNWRQKHDEFIKTVRAAREVTAAMKQGKELPPPPPPTINPDYIQCPHCMRRFNEKAAERHIPFCAEQSKRLSNKKTLVNNSTKQAAASRASVRQQYRPPMPRKKEIGATKPSATQTVSVTSRPSFSNSMTSTRGVSNSTARQKKLKPEWDSSDVTSDKNDVTKTGLRPSSSTKYKASGKATQPSNKPMVRKVAGKKTNSILESNRPSNNVGHYDYSLSYGDGKAAAKAGVVGGRRGGVAKLTTNSQPDFYDWLQPDDLHSKSRPQPQSSKFCHECGARFPVANAKFCCECGIKRIAIN